MKLILTAWLGFFFSPLYAKPAPPLDTLADGADGGIHPSIYKPKTSRLLILGSGHIIGLAAAYDQTQKSWGSEVGKFHFKSDWSGDHLAQNDEASHLTVSYTLTKELYRAYRWAGFSPKKARLCGALESTFLMTFVEVPLDAFNPTQGFGVEDLLANYTGIGLGILKLSRPANWDIKTSAKSNPFSSQEHLFSQASEQFDNFIFWGTYRPSFKWGGRQPVSLGLGYGTRRDSDGFSPLREVRLGIGTTLPDLICAFAPSAAKYFEVLDFYYFNLNWRITLK